LKLYRYGIVRLYAVFNYLFFFLEYITSDNDNAIPKASITTHIIQCIGEEGSVDNVRFASLAVEIYTVGIEPTINPKIEKYVPLG